MGSARRRFTDAVIAVVTSGTEAETQMLAIGLCATHARIKTGRPASAKSVDAAALLVMMRPMLTGSEYLDIRGSIIRWITVYVMGMFTCAQFATNVSCGNEAMLIFPDARIGDFDFPVKPRSPARSDWAVAPIRRAGKTLSAGVTPRRRSWTIYSTLGITRKTTVRFIIQAARVATSAFAQAVLDRLKRRHPRILCLQGA